MTLNEALAQGDFAGALGFIQPLLATRPEDPALLRLAGDPVAQRELRASLTDDPVAMESLAKKTNVQPAWWRTSASAKEPRSFLGRVATQT